MPIANSLMAELEQESASTARMLERVPLDNLAWQPHQKSMTLGRLAWHLASIPAIATKMLSVGAFDVANARPPDMPAQPDFGAQLRLSVGSAREKLASMDDAALKEPFTLLRAGVVVREMPKIIIARSIMLNHSYHHRGQLSVYLRLLDIPVPAMYGTSADETL